MDVTLACDDESDFRHTKVFLNKNLLQCYHNNRGYCSFGDKCRYKHNKEICSKTICREPSCSKRHPVICKYRDQCRFFKMNTCAFKHTKIAKKVENEDQENNMEMYKFEIENLKHEITALKDDIKIKERELLERREETAHLNKMIESQAEKDMKTENDNLKMIIETLEKENKTLKIQLRKQDQTNKSEIEPETLNLNKFSCEKCCLNYSSMEKLKRHRSEMHTVMLSF